MSGVVGRAACGVPVAAPPVPFAVAPKNKLKLVEVIPVISGSVVDDVLNAAHDCEARIVTPGTIAPTSEGYAVVGSSFCGRDACGTVHSPAELTDPMGHHRPSPPWAEATEPPFGVR